jgi:hypothetical protein
LQIFLDQDFSEAAFTAMAKIQDDAAAFETYYMANYEDAGAVCPAEGAVRCVVCLLPRPPPPIATTSHPKSPPHTTHPPILHSQTWSLTFSRWTSQQNR